MKPVSGKRPGPQPGLVKAQRAKAKKYATPPASAGPRPHPDAVWFKEKWHMCPHNTCSGKGGKGLSHTRKGLTPEEKRANPELAQVLPDCRFYGSNERLPKKSKETAKYRLALVSKSSSRTGPAVRAHVLPVSAHTSA